MAPCLRVAVAAMMDDDDVVVADNAGTMRPQKNHIAAVLPNWEVKVPIQPFLAGVVVAAVVGPLLLLLLLLVQDEQFARDIPLPDIGQRRAHSKCKPKSLETASALATAGSAGLGETYSSS